MNKFIFDVDGTLTPSRGIIDPEFEKWFLSFCASNDVYLVTGSDRSKTLEQLGTTICYQCNAVYQCSGNEVYHASVIVRKNNWIIPTTAKTWLLTQLHNNKFNLRTGNHLEERTGMANFSIVGRNANTTERAKYVKWDSLYDDRITIATEFNKLFPTLEARLGGETGLDISLTGYDKSQIIKDFDTNDTIYFFGDRMEKGGNDYPLSSVNPGYNFHVNDWKDTWNTLKTLL